ncbi:amidase, partial [Streptomyces albidoflavus]|uniref:amidase n=1 Tax=Streptomyces albidoflavus TaxID=1886 RepID=UPI003421C633
MSEKEAWKCTALEQSNMLAHRAISPSELLEETIGRVHQINPAINAIVTIDEQRARADARESERRQLAGNRLSPVDGLIITVKDNIFVRNMRTTWGSRLYENFVPELDDIAVERLRAGGAIILGKTNTPEFALSAVTDNLVFGPTRNPWDLNCTPGGSSGGAAAAVAAGLSPLALATDAGGSIRRPCSYTGTVGLKPSIGQVPRCHSFPATAFDLQTIGPIGRTVDDVAMMFDVIAGPDQRDRSTSNFQSGIEAERSCPTSSPARSADS